MTYSQDTTPKKPVGRRLFLKVLAGLIFCGFVPAHAWAGLLSRFPTRTVEKAGFRFDPKTGMVKFKGKGEIPYQLTVDGLVNKPLVFSYEDLKSLPQTEQVSDFHCVEGWSVGDVRWGGFRFKEILKRAKPKSEARYAVFHSLGETRFHPKRQKHYLESFPIDELLDPAREILMVLDLDGKPLSHDRGAPLRLIAPYDLAYKSIKFVTRVELIKQERAGWWTLANPIYPIKARVPRYRLRKK